MEAASEMAPSAKQQIEAPAADEWELSVENLREWLLKPFERSRQPIIEAKKIMQDDGISDQLIAQNLSFEKGVLERNRAETIKLTTNPRTGKLWDLDTLSAAGMVSEAERENIIREHNGREPPYYYVSQLHRIYDDRTNPPKSYLTANCMFEGIAVGKREHVINHMPNRKMNASFTFGIEHSAPLEWNTMKDPYDRNNIDEEKKVATFNSANWYEGQNSPKIYTIPFSRNTAEKLLARGKDGLPGLTVQNLSNNRVYGVKLVEDFLTDDGENFFWGGSGEYARYSVFQTWTEPDPYHWSGSWQPVGYPYTGTGPFSWTESLCAASPDGVNIEVFVIASEPLKSQNLYRTWTSPDPYHWVNWAGGFPGHALPFHSRKVSMTDWANNELQVFMFGGWDLLHHIWTYGSNTHWNPDGWIPVGSSLGQHSTFGQNSACIGTVDRNIHVFGWRGDGVLHHLWTEPDPYHWNQGGWTALGPAFADNFDLAATSWNGTNIQVFAFNQGVLHHIWTTDPYHWNQGGWQPLGQSLRHNSVDPYNLAACKWVDGNIQVFARGGDNRLYHMYTEPDPEHWNAGGWVDPWSH